MCKRMLFAAAGLAALSAIGGCAITAESSPDPRRVPAFEAEISELEEANRVARLELAEEQERNNAQVFLMRQEITRLQNQIAALRERCGEICRQ